MPCANRRRGSRTSTAMSCVCVLGRLRSAQRDTERTVFTPVLAIADTSCVDFPSDPGLVAVALRFGVAPNALLGHGGEAWVYAVGNDRVLTILRDAGRKADVLRSSCARRSRRPHRRRLDRRSEMARIPGGPCGQESVEVDPRTPASRPGRHCRGHPDAATPSFVHLDAFAGNFSLTPCASSR
jgi:hypothetical protein